jgi:chromosome segregation ATPase
MPVSVGNIPDITQRVHDSVDPINVTLGDIANTCKSNKSQSDELAGDALDEAKKQNGPVIELLSHLSQALTPITADMISLTAQVNAKLRPYEAEVTRAQEEQIQIAQSNNWYVNEIAGEEADIVAAQAAFDALDTESETYADDASNYASEISTSQIKIDIYNDELGILNGPYATDWEAHRAYHQAS